MNIYSHVTPTLQKATVDRFAAPRHGTQRGFQHMGRFSASTWTKKAQVRAYLPLAEDRGFEPLRVFTPNPLSKRAP